MPPIVPISSDIPGDDTNNESNSASNHIPDPVSDSDSEYDDDHDGYLPLSQDPDSILDEQEDNQIVSDDECSPHEGAILSFNPLLTPAVPSTTESSIEDVQSANYLKLDADHIETIKSVMKGITLPSVNVPQWATVVPEEEWKAALFSSVLSKSKSSSKNGCLIENSDIGR